ncbi:MAG: putative periplasmic or secreted lipoprotein [Actinomycetia bacterium]|nr:putative periplasmic or secreted lipoprotein [Actinomycetes bacterium]
MNKPNNLLKLDVEDQLAWDPQVDMTRIVVSADAGKITLTGAVPSLYQVTRAGDDAMLVGGVKMLDNQLLVGLLGNAITDAQIAAAGIDALNGDSFVPKGAVAVDVRDGWVTLGGEVRHHYQRLAAEHAVGKVDGVLGIDNGIALTDAPIPSDVADRIKNAFQRAAIINDSQIEVSNVGHTVYLDGNADSWVARQAAEDTAWNAPGVTMVVDRLQVA